MDSGTAYKAAIDSTLKLFQVAYDDLYNEQQKVFADYPEVEGLPAKINAALEQGDDTPITLSAKTLHAYGAARSMNGGALEIQNLATVVAIGGAICEPFASGEQPMGGLRDLIDELKSLVGEDAIEVGGAVATDTTKAGKDEPLAAGTLFSG